MKVRTETKIGLTVVIAIALLYFGINYLKGVNPFKEERVFYGVYSKVNGLEASNPVVLNGFQIGRVKDIQLLQDPRGMLLVSFVITQSIDIPKDTKARLESADLLGSMHISLDLGRSLTMAQSGDTLTPEIESDLAEAVNEQLRPLKVKTEGLISSVDSVLTVIQAILNNESQQNLVESFGGINNAIRNLERTSLRLDTLIAQEKTRIDNIFANIETISTGLAGNTDDMQNIIENFSQISDSLAKADVAKTIVTANAALTQVQQTVEKINRGEGSLGLLINDDELYENLKQASNNMDLLMEDIRINPNRYIHFSVFGRRSDNSNLSRSEMQQLKKFIEEQENQN